MTANGSKTLRPPSFIALIRALPAYARECIAPKASIVVDVTTINLEPREADMLELHLTRALPMGAVRARNR